MPSANGLLVALAAVALLLPAASTFAPAPARSSEAYATLLYGDAFLLGVRVLGQSLRETGTTRCILSCALSLELGTTYCLFKVRLDPRQTPAVL